MPVDKSRFTISIPKEMMEQIDEFRFANHYSKQNAAVLELLRLGLEALKQQTKENGAKETQ